MYSVLCKHTTRKKSENSVWVLNPLLAPLPHIGTPVIECMLVSVTGRSATSSRRKYLLMLQNSDGSVTTFYWVKLFQSPAVKGDLDITMNCRPGHS